MIKLIKAFPYDNNYDYTKTFNTKAEQTTFFNSFEYEEIDNTNYVKVNNSFNVELSYDYMDNEGFNYIVFNNGFRDIFAFIVQKEYLKTELTRIIYEVDVIQTYLFNFSVGNSFIERKVCTIAEITDFDEGLNIGEHSIVSDTTAFTKNSTYFAMFSGIKNYEVTVDTSGKITHYAEIPSSTQKPSTKIDGISYPLFFVPVNNTMLNILSDHPSLAGIVRMPHCTYTTQQIKIPTLLKVDPIVTTDPPYYTTADYLVDVALDITSVSDNGSGGSVAKGEVTDFFPYTYYVLTDGEGIPVIMKPQELPSGLNVVGKYALSHQPIERFYVEGFKGDSSGKVYNITNTNQMMLPTATSDGMAYISANGGSLKMARDNQVLDNVLSGAIALGGAMATGGMSLAFAGNSIVGGINQVRQADQRLEDKMLTPNSISSYGTPSTRNSFGTNSVRVLKYSVTSIVKDKIRNYILRFGNKFNNYATIDLKTYKGFIKYIMPNIDSTIDNMYINKIKEILERGVYIE